MPVNVGKNHYYSYEFYINFKTGSLYLSRTAKKGQAVAICMLIEEALFLD